MTRAVLVALLSLALGAAAAPADSAPPAPPAPPALAPIRQTTDLSSGSWPSSSGAWSTFRNEMEPSSSRVAR
ncbi:MAG: hypothetical protein QOD86_2340 [Miltoncostaeaceae bacterium]|nr:hypothetical protein [Miltoncostaeaceae bacterium]